MAPSLEQLPVELIERLVSLLTIEDVGKLRLVSRELRSKASQGSYLSCFTTRSVDLTKKSIESLIGILSDDNLSRKLKHLTITGIIYDPQNANGLGVPFRGDSWEPLLLSTVPKGYCFAEAKGIAETNEHRDERRRVAKLLLERAEHQLNVECDVYPDLLKRAFLNVKSYCGDGVLDTLRLDCMVEAGLDERYDLGVTDSRSNISAHASYIFTTTIQALAATSLPVKHIDVFSSTRYCSLACTELAALVGRSPANFLRPVASGLHSLSLSFSRLADSEAQGASSVVCCDCNSRRLRRSDTEVFCHHHHSKFEEDDDNHCTSEGSLASFLAKFSFLESLELHQYEIERPNDRYNPVAFELITREVRLPKLRKCTLRGINADDKNLLAFLRAHPDLQHLDLRHVNLNEGQWQPVFAHIKTHMGKLQTLNMEDLYEHKRADNVPMPSVPPSMLPPPPGLMLNGLGHMPPPPPPQINVETYLNTLITFRVLNIPDDQVVNSGIFKTNKTKITGPWIAKADILYGFVSHAANKWKAEKRWDRERMREYGPPPDTLLDM